MYMDKLRANTWNELNEKRRKRILGIGKMDCQGEGEPDSKSCPALIPPRNLPIKPTLSLLLSILSTNPSTEEQWAEIKRLLLKLVLLLEDSDYLLQADYDFIRHEAQLFWDFAIDSCFVRHNDNQYWAKITKILAYLSSLLSADQEIDLFLNMKITQACVESLEDLVLVGLEPDSLADTLLFLGNICIDNKPITQHLFELGVLSYTSKVDSATVQSWSGSLLNSFLFFCADFNQYYIGKLTHQFVDGI